MELKDRINAVIRTPAYKKEYDEFWKNENHDTWPRLMVVGAEIYYRPLSLAADKLCSKFKIPYPFHPKTIVPDDFPAAMPISRTIDGKCLIELDEDHCISVKIDLTQTITKIKKDVGDVCKRFKSVNKNRDRDNKKINCSIWKVHDMMTEQHLSINKIAEKLGMDGKPNFHPKARAKYKQVEDAIIKTKRMVEDVQKDFL